MMEDLGWRFALRAVYRDLPIPPKNSSTARLTPKMHWRK
jgi:hypothetical protein